MVTFIISNNFYYNQMLSTLPPDLIFLGDPESLPHFPKAVSLQLSNPCFWHIYSKQYLINGWSEISRIIKQSPIQELQISDNEYPGILKEIVTIQMPNLLSLSLISNRIVSVQPFIFMQSPKLENLYLGRNFIRKISPLRKAHLPNLKLIIINENPIVDCETLSECCFKKLQFIIFENWLECNVISPDVSNLMKLEALSLKFMGIRSGNRIKQSQKILQLSNRYRDLNISNGDD